MHLSSHVTGGDTNRRTEVQVGLGKKGHLISKTKAGQRLAQVVEHLPSNCQSPDQVHPWYHQKKGKQKPNQCKNYWFCGSSDRTSA
jgi:hypothetical protein